MKKFITGTLLASFLATSSLAGNGLTWETTSYIYEFSSMTSSIFGVTCYYKKINAKTGVVVGMVQQRGFAGSCSGYW